MPLSLRFDSFSSKCGQLKIYINPPNFFSHAETHYYCILIAHLFNVDLQWPLIEIPDMTAPIKFNLQTSFENARHRRKTVDLMLWHINSTSAGASSSRKMPWVLDIEGIAENSVNEDLYGLIGSDTVYKKMVEPSIQLFAGRVPTSIALLHLRTCSHSRFQAWIPPRDSFQAHLKLSSPRQLIDRFKNNILCNHLQWLLVGHLVRPSQRTTRSRQ